ncbi:MAG: ABC transporter ATP-binding protein [Oscillospiraceae bacterium]|nr:ABC transporter ATP-binding protein [Oscillospiraceae bacterium]
MERKPIIEFKDFSFKYKIQSKATLHDINLTIYEGEKVLILGPSGCGKSTLMSCINGLIPFSNEGTITGSCKVNGRETKNLSIFELSKEVGTVLQDSDAQFVGLSVGEDIAFSMENEMVPRKEMIPEVEKLAGTVGMQDFIDALPFDLSGGQKQKVALAGVISDKVNILMFDEPLAALDPKMGLATIELIDQVSKDKTKTVIIIEHRLEDVLYRPVDRIILMGEGKIIADTTPIELLNSDLLKQSGVREPLYITAMKYAGCDISKNKTICDIENLELSDDDKEKLMAFFHEETPEIKKEPGEEVIRLENVSFGYEHGKNVVKDVDIAIKKGERVAVVGKNGAGKSTMAKLITGIHRPGKGHIYIGGKDYKKFTVKEIGEQVGYVMQMPNQMIVKDIIKDEVELALRLRNISEEEITERSSNALKACGLYSMRKWPVDSISYGQKKRVTVASIMALGPDTIILDEPTAGQDYRHYTDIIKFINRLNSEYGKTIIFITHDMHLAIENTDRAIVFADGEIIADESVYSVLSNDEIIDKANLKQTSLYRLAKKMDISPEKFIEHFIRYERMVKSGE